MGEWIVPGLCNPLKFLYIVFRVTSTVYGANLGAGNAGRRAATHIKMTVNHLRPAVGPTQPRVQCVPGVLFSGAKARPGHDIDHSPPSSVEVEYEQELYLLSTQAPSKYVVEELWHLLII
jgi:hypothetical protein